MNEPISSVPVPPSGFRLKRLRDLLAQERKHTGWLWHGYLAPGNVTLLTSQWKAGKTTLISVLLSKLKAAGTFLDLAVRPGQAVVVSEEAEEHWLTRADRLDFGPEVSWLCRPFAGKPRPAEWLALIDHLASVQREQGLDLAVIDPLAAFLPGHSENDAGTMLDVLLPLQRLTALGVAVLVAHHPKKGETAPGQAARGSGALSGYVDISIEMNWDARPQEDDRRRRLLTFSRHEQTPRRLLIELNTAGTDYLTHGDFVSHDDHRDWSVLRGVLEDAHDKLTRRDILKNWPEDFPKPEESTLWRWLDREVKDGRVLRGGTGRRNDPLRYWLPGMEKKWESDPFHMRGLPPLDERGLLNLAKAVLTKKR